MRAFPIASIANLSLSLSICLSLSLSICLFIPLSLYGELFDKSLINEVGRKVDDLRHVMNRGMTLWQNVLCPRICSDFECVFWIPSFLVVVVLVDYCCCWLLLLLLFVVVDAVCVGFDVIRIGWFVCGRDIVCENWVSHIYKERRVRKKEKKEN